LHPPTFASAALLADDPAERASLLDGGLEVGCLTQQAAAMNYECRLTPWLRWVQGLLTARSTVAATPATARHWCCAALCFWFAAAELCPRPKPWRIVVLRSLLSPAKTRAAAGATVPSCPLAQNGGSRALCWLRWPADGPLLNPYRHGDCGAPGGGHSCGCVLNLRLPFYTRTQRA